MAKYKERRGESNVLNGYIRTADNASIPIADGNSDYRDVLKWLADGNIPDADDTLLDKVKQAKINEYKKEGIKRISAQVSAWDSIEVVGLIASVWNMLGTPNAVQTKAKDIYAYVKNVAIPNVMAQIDIASVQAIDVVNDVNWP